jgi:hypothetical protein
MRRLEDVLALVTRAGVPSAPEPMIGERGKRPGHALCGEPLPEGR